MACERVDDLWNSDETVRKLASAPECVDGLCDAVMKRLDEKEAGEREARRKRLESPSNRRARGSNRIMSSQRI